MVPCQPQQRDLRPCSAQCAPPRSGALTRTIPSQYENINLVHSAGALMPAPEAVRRLLAAPSRPVLQTPRRPLDRAASPATIAHPNRHIVLFKAFKIWNHVLSFFCKKENIGKISDINSVHPPHRWHMQSEETEAGRLFDAWEQRAQQAIIWPRVPAPWIPEQRPGRGHKQVPPPVGQRLRQGVAAYAHHGAAAARHEDGAERPAFHHACPDLRQLLQPARGVGNMMRR